MSSRLRAKSLEEHHLLRAVQYPNFQLDNVNDEAVNQYQQTKIHNEIINQHSISDRISQRKRGRSSTGSIGIASVTAGGRTANINHDCLSRCRDLGEARDIKYPIYRFGHEHRQHIK